MFQSIGCSIHGLLLIRSHSPAPASSSSPAVRIGSFVTSRDPIWEHAEQKGNRFVCNFCKCDFARGISRLKSHLSGVKGRDIDTCTLIPEDVQAKVFLAISGGDSSVSNKRSRKVTSRSHVGENGGGDIFLKSYDISQDRKTGSFLKDICSKVIDSVGPENVVQFITDNASNFESAGDQLVGKYPTMFKTGCGAHGIQLLLKDIYVEVQWVKSVIDDAKSIQNYIYRLTIVTSSMRDTTKDKELKCPCSSKFASNFQMLQSIVNVEDELRMFVASPQWRGLDYSKQTLAKKVETIIHNPEFWSEAKAVIKVCEPMVRVLRLVDGDGSTFPYLCEAMELARESIKACARDVGESKYTRILFLFEKRRRDNVLHPLHSVAAFLNQAYMTSSNFRETRDMKEGINYMVENMLQEDEKFDFTSQIQVYRSRSSSLFTGMAWTMIKTAHPRVWWDFCGDDLPVLKKYATRLLSQPCSSSSCERNWSVFEAARTKKRNRLSPKMLNILVFVRMNRMMIEKMSSKESQDLMPIDLDNLGDVPDYAEKEIVREDAEDITHDRGYYRLWDY